MATLERDAAALIDRARERSSPIVITQNGRPTAVLVDLETFERQRRAIALLELLAEGDRDIERGRSRSHAEVGSRIRARLRGAR